MWAAMSKRGLRVLEPRELHTYGKYKEVPLLKKKEEVYVHGIMLTFSL